MNSSQAFAHGARVALFGITACGRPPVSDPGAGDAAYVAERGG